MMTHLVTCDTLKRHKNTTHLAQMTHKLTPFVKKNSCVNPLLEERKYSFTKKKAEALK